jgi:hypothetical protein
MTDYYPVIARCLEDLGQQNRLTRHELYWLARAELDIQLASLDPPASRLEIARERRALDQAIRRIEDERLAALGSVAFLKSPRGGASEAAAPLRQPIAALPAKRAGASLRPVLALCVGLLLIISLTLALQ